MLAAATLGETSGTGGASICNGEGSPCFLWSIQPAHFPLDYAAVLFIVPEFPGCPKTIVCG